MGTHAGVPYVVTELLQGETLREESVVVEEHRPETDLGCPLTSVPSVTWMPIAR